MPLEPARADREYAEILTAALADVAAGLRAMSALMPRMTDGCRPAVFHARIRAQLAHLDVPVLFEGVRSRLLARRTLRVGGASGAQSPTIPCIDAFLGIGHAGKQELPDWSPDRQPALSHLPRAHRALIARLRATAPASAAHVRQLVARLQQTSPEDATGEAALAGAGAGAGVASAKDAAGGAVAAALVAAHEDALTALVAFRKAHMALVREFIVSPSISAHATAPKAALDAAAPALAMRAGGDSPGGGSVSPTAVSSPLGTPLLGTGGSELLGFLAGRLVDTARAGVRRHLHWGGAASLAPDEQGS